MASFGALSAQGTGTTSVVAPPGLGFALIGLLVNHATLTLDAGLNVTGVTNAVPLLLVQ
jgi:hypothetical protein